MRFLLRRFTFAISGRWKSFRIWSKCDKTMFAMATQKKDHERPWKTMRNVFISLILISLTLLASAHVVSPDDEVDCCIKSCSWTKQKPQCIKTTKDDCLKQRGEVVVDCLLCDWSYDRSLQFRWSIIVQPAISQEVAAHIASCCHLHLKNDQGWNYNFSIWHAKSINEIRAYEHPVVAPQLKHL